MISANRGFSSIAQAVRSSSLSGRDPSQPVGCAEMLPYSCYGNSKRTPSECAVGRCACRHRELPE